MPAAPDGLIGNAAIAWAAMVRTIAQSRSITEADLLQIEIAATAWSRWRAIETKIAEVGAGNPLAGEVSKGANGQLQVSALRQAATQARSEFNSLAVALGIDTQTDLSTIDLFGYPDRPGRGRKGRPAYRPNIRDRNRVRLLLAMGWATARIAGALEVSVPTLHKYFRVELREREVMRDRLDARRLEIAMEHANAGNISALRELGKLIERQEAMNPKAASPAAKDEAKLGKKEALLQAARKPTADWADLIEGKLN